MTELGNRFYNTILNHIRSFTYNEPGGMLLLTDVKEYKFVSLFPIFLLFIRYFSNCIDSWGMPSISRKFEVLPALCNLLVVKPENLDQACAASTLAEIDRNLIQAFIQLRQNFKGTKRNLGIFS